MVSVGSPSTDVTEEALTSLPAVRFGIPFQSKASDPGETVSEALTGSAGCLSVCSLPSPQWQSEQRKGEDVTFAMNGTLL
ncbi:MAG: hypothetical protein ABJN26_22300 [Stappiaceae bacterium]